MAKHYRYLVTEVTGNKTSCGVGHWLIEKRNHGQIYTWEFWSLETHEIVGTITGILINSYRTEEEQKDTHDEAKWIVEQIQQAANNRPR